MLDLDAIEARAEAATPGPWRQTASRRGYKDVLQTPDTYSDRMIAKGCPNADAAFIAHARTDVPALVAELRAAREVLVFADGLAVANTGFPLAALYAEDYEPAQQALKAAGCFPAAYRAVVGEA